MLGACPRPVSLFCDFWQLICYVATSYGAKSQEDVEADIQAYNVVSKWFLLPLGKSSTAAAAAGHLLLSPTGVRSMPVVHLLELSRQGSLMFAEA